MRSGFYFYAYGMQKIVLTILLIAGSFCLAWCGLFLEAPETKQLQDLATSWLQVVEDTTREFIETNPYAQQAQELVNHWYTQAQEQAQQLIDQASMQVQQQYEQLKSDVKNNLKENVNSKIDATFDRI